MKLKIYLDLDEFDKKELSKREWNSYINKLNLLTKITKEYLKKGFISKTMCNRITRLWLFLPREKDTRKFMSTQQFHNHFEIEPLDIKKTQVALNKLYEAYKKEI